MGRIQLSWLRIMRLFFSSHVKQAVFLLLLLLFVFRAPLLMKHFTKGFHLARFESILHSSDIERLSISVDPADEKEALAILAQPFTYLDRGAQCYVFESQDQKYVMKIFQENRCATSLSRWKKKAKEKKETRKHTDFRSCLIAYTLAKNETALVYLHLLPTQNLLPKLSVRSPLGQWYRLPLDRYCFVIQKKVKPFQETLFQASLEGNLPVYLSSFLSLLDSRLAKGIRNEDRSLSSNFGFLDQKAVEIDFGRYWQSESFLQSDLQKIEKKIFVDQLREFIEKQLPHEMETLEKSLLQAE